MAEVVEVGVSSVIAVDGEGEATTVELESTAQTIVEVGYSQPSGANLAGDGAGYYEQVFSNPQTVFTVNHNLNQYPSVVFINSSGVQFFGDVVYNGPNQVTLTLSAAESGTLYCN